jgi:hypothetical protein
VALVDEVVVELVDAPLGEVVEVEAARLPDLDLVLLAVRLVVGILPQSGRTVGALGARLPTRALGPVRHLVLELTDELERRVLGVEEVAVEDLLADRGLQALRRPVVVDRLTHSLVDRGDHPVTVVLAHRVAAVDELARPPVGSTRRPRSQSNMSSVSLPYRSKWYEPWEPATSRLYGHVTTIRRFIDFGAENSMWRNRPSSRCTVRWPGEVGGEVGGDLGVVAHRGSPAS